MRAKTKEQYVRRFLRRCSPGRHHKLRYRYDPPDWKERMARGQRGPIYLIGTCILCGKELG